MEMLLRILVLNISWLAVLALRPWQPVPASPRPLADEDLASRIRSADENVQLSCSDEPRRQLLSHYSSAIMAASLGWGTHNRQSVCWSLEPEQAALDYNGYASTYDDLDGGAASNLLGLDQARSHILSRASGHVLEIGAGTGLNLDQYPLSQLQSLTLVDISSGMLGEAKKRVQRSSTTTTTTTNTSDSSDSPLLLLGGTVPVRFIQADATSQLVDLFGEDSFDTVVDSFSLCVMGTQGASKCLQQMSRVVKPKGQILLLENSRSSNPLLGWYQDATADAAASMGGKGCVYNQDVRAMILHTSSLQIDQEDLYAAGLFRAFQVSRK